MTKRMAGIIFLTLPLAVAHSEESAKVFPAAALRAMDIQAEAGDIRVEGSDTPEVKVLIIDQYPAKCEFTTEINGGMMRLKAKGKSKLFWRPGCKAGFQVQSPKGISFLGWAFRTIRDVLG